MKSIEPDSAKLKLVSDLISKEQLAVLSTVTADFLPEAAVVAISEQDNLELIFGTYKSARKYENLKKNPRVALVIGWDKGRTIQYEGEAIELEGEELKRSLEIYLAKVPSASKFVGHEEEAFFKVKPRWIRFSDLHKDPWETFEIIFPV